MKLKSQVAVVLVTFLSLVQLNCIHAQEQATITASDSKWRVHWHTTQLVFASRKIENLDQREFFAQLELAVPAESMLALLLNTENVNQWVHHATHAEVLQQYSLDHYLVYSQYSPPWPVRNRDLVSESWHWQTDEGIWLQARAKPLAIPERDGFVRVTNMQNCWFGRRVSDQSSLLMYLGHIQDPGSLPNFVINSAQKGVLKQTLKNLLDVIPHYSKAAQKHWDFPAPKQLGYCQRLKDLIDSQRVDSIFE